MITPDDTRQFLPTLGELTERTYTLYWADTKGAKTARSNSSDVVRVVGEDKLIADIDQRVVNDLLAVLKERGLSPASINRKMAALGKVLTLAVEEGIIQKKPKLPRLRENNQRVKCFTEVELEGLFGHMQGNGHPDVVQFCLCLLETGMRGSEAHRMKWGDSGFVGGVESDGVARIYHTKSGDPRSIPLTKMAKEVLRDRAHFLREMPDALDPDSKPWESVTQSRLTHVWNQARKALDFTAPDCVPHSLRHTCASRLARSGVDLLSIKEWLGHRSLTMTLRYSHLCLRQLEDARTALENYEEAGE